MKKYIGDKAFYKAVLVILIPIVLQNFITSFVNLLDNMMVGQLGTMQFSGVSIVNQLITIYNLVIFGSMAAVGIFSAQYAGNKDHKGVRQCLHLKLIIATLVFAAGAFVLTAFGKPLISLYLDESVNTSAQIEETLNSAMSYMKLVLVGMLPFAYVQVFSSTLRETRDTFLPMVTSMIAVGTNFVFNYILIFGHFGFPELGVRGAAIATNISRFIELGVILAVTFLHKEKHEWLTVKVPALSAPWDLVKNVIVRGFPLILNELLFSLSLAVISQCYSTRGLSAVAAVNITSTISHLFTIFASGMGHSIGIMVGQELGAGRHEEAMDIDMKLIALSVVLCSCLAVVMYTAAPLIPGIYKTDAETQRLACELLRVAACKMPLEAIYFGSYFTLRCGGKTVLTLLFDSGYICLVTFPVAFVLSHFTSLGIFPMYLLVVLSDIPKGVLGFTLVKKGIWVNTII